MNKFTIKMDDKWMAITVKDWDKLKDDCGEMAMTVSNYEGLNETYLEDLNTLKDAVREFCKHYEKPTYFMNKKEWDKFVKDIDALLDKLKTLIK